MFSLEKASGRPYSSFSVSKRAYKKDGEGWFLRVRSDTTGGNGFKLKKGRFGSEIQRKLCIVKEVRHWQRLPSCGCTIPGSVQGELGWSFEHPGLMDTVHDRGFELGDL